MVVAEDEVQLESNEENNQSVNNKIANKPVYTVEILKIIKDAQQQHGLRHSDHQRYRGYCTRRIRRLRKVLHITQGDKRHFKRKDVTEAMIKDERYLFIPLTMAERAWSHAMQLRQESNTEPRKKFHLMSRLRKAATYAQHVQTLCESAKFDARTKLEGQAYQAWMQGTLEMELESWRQAIENLKKAEVVYEKLAMTLSEEDQVLYKKRVEELAPALRYCAYNIGEETDIKDLMQMRGQGNVEMMTNLEALITQTRERRAEVLCEIEWRGRSFPVRPEKVRLFLISEQELDGALEQASDIQARISLIENFLMELKDAISLVKDELKSDQGNKTRAGTGGPISSMQYLLSYLAYIRHTRTIQRTLLMVEASKNSQVEKGDAASAEGRKSQPQYLTRLYEIIIQNCLEELQQLPGLEEDSSFQQEIEAQKKAYKAFRCFYMAQSLESMKHWREAMALYKRALQYAKEANSGNNIKLLDNELKAQLQALQKDIGAHEFSAHAHSVLEGEPQEGQPIGAKPTRIKKPLYDRLGEYREDPLLLSKTPNVYKLPPEMVPIPCKPLFFDLASNMAEFPDLEDKLESPAGRKGASAGLTGFVNRFLGWGGSGKK